MVVVAGAAGVEKLWVFAEIVSVEEVSVESI